MTNPIDVSRSIVASMLRAFPHSDSLPIDRKSLETLAQPDPRVTALVEAVKDYLAGTINDNFDLRNDLWAAIRPFLKENQDA